ncbi:MAG: hypothetical protein ACLSA6_19575 [Holdemania massiliensis]
MNADRRRSGDVTRLSIPTLIAFKGAAEAERWLPAQNMLENMIDGLL